MNEACESKVANLLTEFDNLPRDDVDGKFRVLLAVLEAQEQEIRELREQFEGYEELTAETAHNGLHQDNEEFLRECESCGEE